jgi:ketosteroid isomerase-like protein
VVIAGRSALFATAHRHTLVAMSESDAKAVAGRFFEAWTTGDFDTARSLLHDDVSFAGPLDRFDSADAYIAALSGLSPMVRAVEERKVFVDGDDVCVIYDLVTNSPAGTAPTAEWYHVRAGRISSVRVFFDARPFAPLLAH